MAWYAHQPARFARQLAADLAMLLWTGCCVLAGIVVHDAVAALAAPLTRVAQSTSQLRQNLTAAAQEVGRVPGLGDRLRRPLDSAVESLGRLISATTDQVAAVHHVAVLLGVVVAVAGFLTPAVLWALARWRFVQASRSARRFVDAAADLELFALRALTNQPLHVLARISDDPVAAWSRGDPAVVAALAEVELRRSGLRLPSPGSSHSPTSLTRDDHAPSTAPDNRRVTRADGRTGDGPAEK